MTGPSEVHPDEMMTGINNVNPGWHPLIRDLEADLREIDPTYTLQQVKEKFGGLRYYASPTANHEAFHARIREAERKADKTCEDCGTEEEVTTEGPGWIRTMCPACRETAKNKREAFWEEVHDAD